MRWWVFALPIIAGILVKMAGLSLGLFISLNWEFGKMVMLGSPADAVPYLVKYAIGILALGLWAVAMASEGLEKLSVLLSLPIIGFSPMSISFHLLMAIGSFLWPKPSRILPIILATSAVIALHADPSYFGMFEKGLVRGLAEAMGPYVSSVQMAVSSAIQQAYGMEIPAEEITVDKIEAEIRNNLNLDPIRKWFPWLVGMGLYFSVSPGMFAVEGMERLAKKSSG